MDNFTECLRINVSKFLSTWLTSLTGAGCDAVWEKLKVFIAGSPRLKLRHSSAKQSPYDGRLLGRTPPRWAGSTWVGVNPQVGPELSPNAPAGSNHGSMKNGRS